MNKQLLTIAVLTSLSVSAYADNFVDENRCDIKFVYSC